MRNCCWKISIAKFVWLTVCLGWAVPDVFAGIEPDFLMDSDPTLQVPRPVENFNPAMATLWMAALARPETDMQRMAAETITRAHQYGIPGLINSVPRLEQILMAESSHPAARFAAARALIVLESHDSEQKLFEASQAFGADLRQLVEPTLAAWDNASAKSVWIKRLQTSDTGPRDLLLAVQGLGDTREQSALDNLLLIVRDQTSNSAVRLAAAAAAGKITETNLEQTADRLAGNARAKLFVNQLCAVRLLARHNSEGAKQILIRLANHEEFAVAAAALHRLNEIDVALVLPLAESTMKSSDPRVRREGATAMLRSPSGSLIVPLSLLLSDPNPGVRRGICEGLHQLSSQTELNELVRTAAMQILAGESWQGQEQAALLLGTLEHQPAADRLVELLESPRTEVRLASAWALRKVAVQQTIPALIERARRQTELRIVKGDSLDFDEEISHLFEALGVLKAEEATSLLLKYVPKRAEWPRSRGAAIWAIGRLNEGKPNAEVEAILSSRILDFSPQPLETSLVKQMSAIALGRMQAVDRAPMMRDFAVSDDVEMRLELALGWAVRALTGEELPPPDPLTVSQGTWFLEPLP